jgi:O-succinylbenzoic acid--CoA ligase
MVNKSPRELLEIPSSWSIPHIQAALESSLQGDGPALTFGASKFKTVESSICIVISTSGSTGSPKEVALTAEALRASALASHQFLGAKPSERWSLMLPTNHIAGINVLVRALELGTDIAPEDFEYTSIVPTQLYRALTDKGELLLLLQNAKAVLVGGAATQGELLVRAREHGINVVTTYGMSEMSGGCVYNNQPLNGVEVEIREGDRIALRGPMQAKEYLGSTKPLADSTGWFVTNDVGFVTAGKLTVLGRVDDQIISGGEKISLAAIDLFLNSKATDTYMSCAIPDPEWGELLCLASSETMDQAALCQQLREQFGKHGVPKLFLSDIELPRTSIGKPDRQTLSKRFERITP